MKSEEGGDAEVDVTLCFRVVRLDVKSEIIGRRVGREALRIPRHSSEVDQMDIMPRDPVGLRFGVKRVWVGVMWVLTGGVICCVLAEGYESDEAYYAGPGVGCFPVSSSSRRIVLRRAGRRHGWKDARRKKHPQGPTSKNPTKQHPLPPPHLQSPNRPQRQSEHHKVRNQVRRRPRNEEDRHVDTFTLDARIPHRGQRPALQRHDQSHRHGPEDGEGGEGVGGDAEVA